VEEYVRDFEKLLIKCDVQESEDQTNVWCLGSLDTWHANVVELQQYSTFDGVCALANGVEQQKKSNPFKRDPLMLPLTKSPPFNMGIF